MVSAPAFTKTEYGTKKLPFTEPEWKIPGYTGYVSGLQETYSKTPVLSQVETQQPPPSSVLYTRTQVPAKHTPERDPCNNKANFQKPVPDTLWPHLQSKALQDSAKPPRSNIMNGDLRTDVFITSYSTSFAAPFAAHKQIRSPMRNATLVNCPTLRQHYTSAYNRVGEKRLYKMVSTMSERLAAKLGNCNDNAFRMRRLFKMYDEKRTGYIELQDFRMMVETFGIQLDDDSLLALFSVYDPQGTGYMHYEDLMKALLDPDYFSLYVGNVDNTQDRLDAANHDAMLATIKGKFSTNAEAMLALFKSLDVAGTGALSAHDFLAGCAAQGVVLNDNEHEFVMKLVQRTTRGDILYEPFCNVFKQVEASAKH